jgi:hypothetical protein
MLALEKYRRRMLLAGCIESSHKILALIYLLVKTNRKYQKRKRIEQRRDDRRESKAGISEIAPVFPDFPSGAFHQNTTFAFRFVPLIRRFIHSC